MAIGPDRDPASSLDLTAFRLPYPPGGVDLVRFARSPGGWVDITVPASREPTPADLAEYHAQPGRGGDDRDLSPDEQALLAHTVPDREWASLHLDPGPADDQPAERWA